MHSESGNVAARRIGYYIVATDSREVPWERPNPARYLIIKEHFMLLKIQFVGLMTH